VYEMPKPGVWVKSTSGLPKSVDEILLTRCCCSDACEHRVASTVLLLTFGVASMVLLLTFVLLTFGVAFWADMHGSARPRRAGGV